MILPYKLLLFAPYKMEITGWVAQIDLKLAKTEVESAIPFIHRNWGEKPLKTKPESLTWNN